MKAYNKYIGAAIVVSLLTLGACNDELDVLEDYDALPEEGVVLPELTAGTANFSSTVAIGASFTAGFTDGALFIAGQENSFPAMLNTQFVKAGGGAITQPLMNDNVGGLLFGGTQIADPRFVFDGAGPAPIQLVNPAATVTTDITTNNPTGPFTNLGVPGSKSFHLVAPGYGDIAGVGTYANPYFVRMATSPTTTVLADAMAQSPTFFTATLIGGNDVLGYAISGGAGTDQTGNLDPTTYGGNDITDPNVFAATYDGIISTLTSGGAKGVVTNIPAVTNLPYFTTVGHNVVPLDAATAAAVNAAYAEYNAGIQAALDALAGTGLFTEEEAEARQINFEESETNAVVIIDEDLTDLGAINPAFAALPKYRQATAEDLLVLPSASFIGTLADPNNPLTVNGVAIPLADNWVLTPQEQTAIATATAAYNTTIESIANANENLAFVDLAAILENLNNGGVSFGDYTLTANLVTGGAVSLDGVHLTARGYAYMAYEFLQAIDAQFGSNFIASGNFPNPGDFPTNYSATLQ